MCTSTVREGRYSPVWSYRGGRQGVVAVSVDDCASCLCAAAAVSDVVVKVNFSPYLLVIDLFDSVDDATAALSDDSLVVGTTTQAYNASIPTGAVVTSNPAPGTKLKRGQAVNLVVSKGPAPVPVPKVVGKSQAQATSALTNAGLKVTSSQDWSKTISAGNVISSDPAAGVVVPKGGTVTIVVSKGPPPVLVPDVYKMAEADAKSALESAGFVVKIIYPIGITPFGRVVAQSPAAGKSLPWGSTIEIQVV